MSYATEAAKSVSDPRVLIDFDIGQLNLQWINIGAGIWEVNAKNVYAYVDDTLLDGFTVQAFGAIASVTVDGAALIEVSTLAEVTTNDKSFFFNLATGSVYIRIINYDEPSLHTIFLGVVYGYSFDEFTLVDSNWPYEARLVGSPMISIQRDPLFFGKLQYGGGSVSIANTDGDLDDFGKENDIYGNEARIKFGYDGLDIDDYKRFYTGYIGDLSVGEMEVSVDIADKRKQLSRPITYTCTAQNAITTIQDILVTYFSAVYNSTYFNTTAWAAAVAAADNVTITMQEPAPAIDIIQGICKSVFGLFIIEADSRYSFKIVDTTATASTTISAIDIRTENKIAYSPTEVISSVRVGYDRDWATTGTQYTYYTDDTHEASVYTQYKTYNEQTFDTYLPTLAEATAYGTIIIDRFRDVHGKLTVEVPMSYYDLEMTDIVNAEIERPQKSMIGTTKSEIVSIEYDLQRPAMNVGLRFV